jgi:hypothetical protein
MSTLKEILSWLVLSNFGRILMLVILTPLFLYLSTVVSSTLLSNIFLYGFYTTSGLIGVYMLVLIAFAWVINPIREAKENKKIRDEYKKSQQK